MRGCIACLRRDPFVMMVILATVSTVVIGWNTLAITSIGRSMSMFVRQVEEVTALEQTLVHFDRHVQANKTYLLLGELDFLLQQKQFQKAKSVSLPDMRNEHSKP